MEYVNEANGFEDEPNMTEYLSMIGDEDRGLFRSSYVTAASFVSGETSADDVTVVAQFNNEAFHTPPLAVNVMTNTLLWCVSTFHSQYLTSFISRLESYSLHVHVHLLCFQALCFIRLRNQRHEPPAATSYQHASDSGNRHVDG